MRAGSTGCGDGIKRAIFCRRISPTSARKRLPVPPWCLVELPNFDGGHAVEMKVVCENEVYGVTCTTRTRGKYSKPVLSKGWIEMARKVQLKAGDKVTIFKLQKTQQNGANYSMEIEKEEDDHHVKKTKKRIFVDDHQYYHCRYNPLLDAAARGSGGPIKLKIFGVWILDDIAPDQEDEVIMPPPLVPAADPGDQPLLDLTLKLATNYTQRIIN